MLTLSIQDRSFNLLLVIVLRKSRSALIPINDSMGNLIICAQLKLLLMDRVTASFQLRDMEAAVKCEQTTTYSVASWSLNT